MPDLTPIEELSKNLPKWLDAPDSDLAVVARDLIRQSSTGLRALLDEVKRLREERDDFLENIDQLRKSVEWSKSQEALKLHNDWLARAEAAEAELARLREPAGDELPDDLRAPLHSLQADREYLVARIRKADDEEVGLLSESIRNRLSQIEEAAYHLNGRLRAPAGDVGEVKP